jgi:4-amino-4-deoxy-L-arabinose transferase-like glycosyltransferase
VTTTELPQHDTELDATPRERIERLRDAFAPEHRGFLRGLLVVSVLAALVRVANVLWWRPTTSRPGYLGYFLSGDSAYYHWQANALAEGQWFVDPGRWLLDGKSVASAAHPPLYSLYLSLWSRIGVDTVTGHRLASSVLGILAVALIGLLAFRLAGPLAGILAATIAALYPQLWINDGMLLSETVAVLAMVCALHALYSFWARPTLRTAIVVGLACGIATLARNEQLLLFPVVVIPLALMTRTLEWRARVKLAAVACVVGALVLAPWVIFNIGRFEEFTTTSSSTGSVLSAASCDEVYYGSSIGYWGFCFDGPWPTGDESERDLVVRNDAVDYIKAHKSQVPLVVLARIGRMWNVFRPGQTTFFGWSIEGNGRVPSYLGLFSFYLLVPFAVYGFVVNRRRRITILPLLAAPVIVTLAAAITFGVTRYRAPAEVSIVVAAAIGVAAIVERRRRRAPSPVPDDAPNGEAPDATVPAGTLADR